LTNRVASDPALTTSRPGKRRRSVSAPAAALARWSSVAGWAWLNSSGDSHTSRPSSRAASAAVMSRRSSWPRILTALQCRSSPLISSSRRVVAASNTGRVLIPPPYTVPTS
jgi:hypothetical protein